MEALYDLKETLHKELEEIAEKGELNAGDLETVHKLTDTIKNIDKICMLEEDDDGYSNAGEWSADGRGVYGRGNSYARRGEHYVRGHYSRDDGYYGRRGRYSRADGKEAMMEQARRMMDNATNDKERDAVRKLMQQLETL